MLGKALFRLLALLPLLNVFVQQNAIPDLINTSIRCDCINTPLITAETRLQAVQHLKEFFSLWQ